MAQNTQSVTASRNTIAGTANDAPATPQLFTEPARREYIPDAKRVGDGAPAPELARAREAFANGDYAIARAEAKRVVRDASASPLARMEAGDLLDRTAIDTASSPRRWRSSSSSPSSARGSCPAALSGSRRGSGPCPR